MAWWQYTNGLFNESDFVMQKYGGNGNDTLDNVYFNIIHIPGPGTYFEGRQGNDKIMGTQHNDILVGVDPDSYNAGAGEYDILSSGFGNGSDKDIFVLGDKYEMYYQGWGYATLQGFDQGYDKIAIHGDVSDIRYYAILIKGIV